MIKKFAVPLAAVMILSIFSANAYASGRGSNSTTDYGPKPYVTNIEQLTRANSNFRETAWTGDLLQLVLMSIPAGEDIGAEKHDKEDQFLFIVEGSGTVQIGDSDKNMSYVRTFAPGSGIFIPVGKWHNITNTGTTPVKLFSVYAPPHHEHSTVHATKDIAEKEH
jgi:mannose-6-phosphate isomerase-like protein (cupin superfamily)